MNIPKVLLCGLAALAVAAAAPAADSKNVVRLSAAWVSPTGDLAVNESISEQIDPGTRLELDGELLLEPDDALGFALSYERRLTDRIGIDVGVIRAKHDVGGRVRGTARLIDIGSGSVVAEVPFDETDDVGSITVMPWIVGVDVHVLGGEAVDLWVQPNLVYVTYGDLDVEGEGTIPIRDELTWGAAVGVDVPLGSRGWLFHGALRFLKTQAEPDESGPDARALDVDPWILHAGVGYRF